MKRSVFKSMDAFPKMETGLTATTKSGGFVSLVVMTIMVLLLFSEVYEWRRLRYEYEFLVDNNNGEKTVMDVNLDMTIAMDWLRIDALDAVGMSLGVDKILRPRSVTYHTDGVENFSSHIDAAQRQKARDDPEWRKQWFSAGVERKDGPLNACHVSGSFPVHKVMGSFMVTAYGHGYMGAHTPHDEMNFTHRIDELSFGKRYPGLVNPLDKTHLVSDTHFANFQYFLGLVPTVYVDDTATFFGRLMYTNQYAVTEFYHAVDPKKPDSLPGIFIKFDVGALSVKVTQKRTGLIQFLTRTFGVIGGVFATSGVVFRLYLGFADFLTAVLVSAGGGYTKL